MPVSKEYRMSYFRDLLERGMEKEARQFAIDNPDLFSAEEPVVTGEEGEIRGNKVFTGGEWVDLNATPTLAHKALSILNTYGLPVQPNEGRQVAPGVQAFETPGKVTPPAPNKGFQPPPAILSKLEDPNNPIKEIHLPDGTKLVGDFVPPVRTPNEPQPVQAPSGNPPPPPTPQSSLENVGSSVQEIYNKIQNSGFADFVRSPAFRATLGQIAQAIGTSPAGIESIGARLGKIGEGLAMGQAYNSYLSQLYQGKTPDQIKGADYDILPPELKQQAMKTYLASKQVGFEGKRVGIEQQRADSYSKLAEAQARGEVTAEEKVRLQELASSIKLKIGTMAYGYLRVNNNTVFNTRTGEIIQMPGGNTANMFKLGDLNSGIMKIFQDKVAALYLNEAKDAYIRQLAEADGGSPEEIARREEELKKTKNQLTIFEDNQAGTVNWQKVLSYLPEDRQLEFTKDLSDFVTNYAYNIPPEYTLEKKMEERISQKKESEKPKVKL